MFVFIFIAGVCVYVIFEIERKLRFYTTDNSLSCSTFSTFLRVVRKKGRGKWTNELLLRGFLSWVSQLEITNWLPSQRTSGFNKEKRRKMRWKVKQKRLILLSLNENYSKEKPSPREYQNCIHRPWILHFREFELFLKEFHSLFLIQQMFIGPHAVGCIFSAIFLHYFMLTNFFWMLVEGMWLSLSLALNRQLILCWKIVDAQTLINLVTLSLKCAYNGTIKRVEMNNN